MTYEISKSFRFEAAHRLTRGYEGKCSNNHGHSWKVILTFQGERLNEIGMLIDFDEIKVINEWLTKHLDHATLLASDDPFLKYLKDNGHKVFEMDGNPTSEKIAELILNKAKEIFADKSARIYKVTVAETCTSKAIVFA